MQNINVEPPVLGDLLLFESFNNHLCLSENSVPSGDLTQLLNMAIGIVSFPIEHIYTIQRFVNL